MLGAAGAAVVALVAGVRDLGRRAPRPVVAEGTTRTVDRYGPEREQQGEWWVPPGATGPLPTVVLVHGGYWRPGYDRSLEDAVAADLAGRGYLVWNVDYRSAAAPWPSTLADVAAAYDHLAGGAHAARVDRERVAVVGHSAGGHLALWLASRRRVGELGTVPGGAPGTAAAPAVVVAQAPVADLGTAVRRGAGTDAVLALLGGTPEEHPERYAVADPLRLLPTGTRVVCLHAEADDLVDIALSRTYVDAAQRAGDDATLVVVPGGHFEHLDPASAAWAAALDALAPLLRGA